MSKLITQMTELAISAAVGTELTAKETNLLTAYEAVIEKGLQSFIEVGRSLAQIRDGGLHRASHATFAAYCEGRWGMSRSRAYQYIDASNVVENVHNCGQVQPILPSNESQARQLSRLPADEQIAAWEEVCETAPTDDSGNPKLTAAVVREVVDQRLEKAAAPPKPKSKKAPKPEVDADYVKETALRIGRIIRATEKTADPEVIEFVNDLTNAAEWLSLGSERNVVIKVPMTSAPKPTRRRQDGHITEYF